MSRTVVNCLKIRVKCTFPWLLSGYSIIIGINERDGHLKCWWTCLIIIYGRVISLIIICSGGNWCVDFNGCRYQHDQLTKIEMFLVKDDDNDILLDHVNIVVVEMVLSFCKPRSRDNHFCQISKVIHISCSLITWYPRHEFNFLHRLPE